jgi:hypothetical protein
VVVSLLRGFGHEMRTMYVFGQRMRKYSTPHLRRCNLSASQQVSEFTERDQEPTRIPKNCTVCPESDGLVSNN